MIKIGVSHINVYMVEYSMRSGQIRQKAARNRQKPLSQQHYRIYGAFPSFYRVAPPYIVSKCHELLIYVGNPPDFVKFFDSNIME